MVEFSGLGKAVGSVTRTKRYTSMNGLVSRTYGRADLVQSRGGLPRARKASVGFALIWAFVTTATMARCCAQSSPKLLVPSLPLRRHPLAIKASSTVGTSLRIARPD